MKVFNELIELGNEDVQNPHLYLQTIAESDLR